MRRQLFAVLPHAEAEWQQRRAEYIAEVSSVEAAGHLVSARQGAQRALQFLPDADPQVWAEPLLLSLQVALNLPAVDLCPLWY